MHNETPPRYILNYSINEDDVVLSGVGDARLSLVFALNIILLLAKCLI